MFDLIKRHKLIFLFFVIIFLFFLNSYSNAYTQVEYIYGDGSQYIDTGIAENNVFGLDFGFRAGSVYANWQCLLGGNVWYQSTEDFGLMNVRYSANSVCCRVRGTQIFGGSSVSTSEMNVFKILNNKWYVNDTSGDVSTSSALGRLSDHIFILNGHTKQRNSRGYIYYLKLYDNNGNLLRDMIPVIDNNNVVCMYDKISQSYFYNGGTGNFTAGPVVVPAIESFFHLEYENSNDFPIVYSKWYDYIDSSKEQDDIYRETIFANQHYYGVKDNEHAYVLFLKNSRDVQGWKSFEGDENENGPGYEDNYETSNDINDLKWRVGYQITDYGEYYFCHYDVEHDTYSIERFIINHNEVVSDYYDVDTGEYTRLETYNETEVSTIIDNVGAYDNLSLRVEQNENVGSIFTNWLNWNNGYNYELYWSKDSINWDSIYSYEENESNKRRYILDVLENGTYYIKLRIFDSNNTFVNDIVKSVIINSIGVNNNVNHDINYYLENNVAYNFFKKHLGALFFPIDLMVQFIQRLSVITETEPVIVVPTINEFFTGSTIINGFSFSLTDVLSNENIANAYNIYLYFADFIVYGWFLRFLYKTCIEVMNIFGGVE